MTTADITRRSDLRNVAIIAHVDHGKTTLVDGLLKQSHIFRDPDAAGNLIMDSNDLERERGITILSKNTAIRYGDIKINVIDTPGHADFGGEVERVLNMADGCILLVDAAEGPMPQTRTVLQRALGIGLRPIVVINKIDRSNARIDEVKELVMDLFLDLAVDESQLEFPTLYAIGRAGRAGFSPDDLAEDLRPLLDTIIAEIPAPVSDPVAPFQMLVTSLDYDSHKGRIVIGRIHQGSINAGDSMAITGEGVTDSRQKVASLMTFEGLARTEITRAEAGDLIALTGFSEAKIGATVCDPNHIEALPSVAIEEPTLKLTFGVNTSPFSGRDGDYSTSRQLKDRLERELETNLSLRVEPTDQPDVFSVAGRGELHISVLIETMRREGYEFQVSRPEVVTRKDAETGETLEPIEHLVVDVVEEFVGVVTELTGGRKARMLDLVNDGRGSVRLEFAIPTRGLIGLRNAMLTATKGNAVMGSRLIDFEPWMGPIQSTRSGALVASETGTILANGIANAQERGITFVEVGTECYEGMIVGQNPRPDDLAVNVCRAKKLTNMRSSNADISVKLTPPTILSLEQSLDFLQDDELLEVTPKALRLRKRWLTQDERQKMKKRAAMAEVARA
ncbi:MAG: translational GTPase TypA [Thermomicrobiales bacterium]|nr:translational GTPase TypA [Thermomicrobiales bacterium]MCO5218157.1 translational GTPase TypA [Thermomicrobiales bacterium]MCO5224879.1 translational GTPase TypA [Thermomicrobiales bacterium]MCO5228943.1 translational GTPase TypA [Thermomicrobiales bacterium]